MEKEKENKKIKKKTTTTALYGLFLFPIKKNRWKPINDAEIRRKKWRKDYAKSFKFSTINQNDAEKEGYLLELLQKKIDGCKNWPNSFRKIIFSISIKAITTKKNVSTTFHEFNSNADEPMNTRRNFFHVFLTMTH